MEVPVKWLPATTVRLVNDGYALELVQQQHQVAGAFFLIEQNKKIGHRDLYGTNAFGFFRHLVTNIDCLGLFSRQWRMRI